MCDTKLGLGDSNFLIFLVYYKTARVSLKLRGISYYCHSEGCQCFLDSEIRETDLASVKHSTSSN